MSKSPALENIGHRESISSVLTAIAVIRFSGKGPHKLGFSSLPHGPENVRC